MAGQPTYLGAVGTAVAHGALTAAWIASGELPHDRRRAVRIAGIAAVVTAGWLTSARDPREFSYTVGEGGLVVVKNPDGTEERRPVRKAALAASATFGLGMIVGRRHLEKRWLDRLRRSGHEHPHRALALRMGLLSLAGTLGSRLIAVHEAEKSR
ncbi:MAG TPA: hypothetical protein VFH03_18915 [Actinoplanes sp.]|nr:hypothetical protein [Actinoplanes sp.]